MTRERDDLEHFFAAARGAERPSDDLVARVLADADAVQAAPASTAAANPSQPRGWLPSIGGWFGAGGLVAATAAGLFIGIAAPEQVDSVLGGQLSSLGLVQSDDLLPGLTDLLPYEGG